jgi:hypothetical protein
VLEPNGNQHYERRDATLRPLVLFLGGLALICAVVFVAMVGLFRLFEHTIAESRLPSGQLSPLAKERVLPEEPRLQVNEPEDLAAYRRRQAHIYSSYGVVDASKGTFRIPVERAMQLLLQRGLPASADGEKP